MEKNILLIIIVAILFSCTPKEENKVAFEQWRGENRDGKYDEKDLLKNWPEEGPDLLWHTEELGEGYGSPIVSENAIFILGTEDSTAVVFAFDLRGNLKWQKEFGDEWNDGFPGSRSTPTLVDTLLYVSSGKGDISCLTSENGETVWSKNMVTHFHGRPPYFGYAQSLLINDSIVYAMPGGIDTNFVALNRFNGEMIWFSKAMSEIPAYNSPKLVNINGHQLIVTYGKFSIIGLDAKTGKMLWSESFSSKYSNHANTIIYEDTSIYTAAATGHGFLRYKLAEDGSSITQIWQDTIIGNYFGGLVKLDDKLYSGSGDRSKYLLRLNAATGEVLDSLETGNGSLIYADGMIYSYGHKNGKVSLVDPETFEIKGSHRIDKGTKEHFSHPVIKNGVLYIRRGNSLLAYEIKRKILDT